MYLSDPIVTLVYENENKYIASLEFNTRKIRVFWEDDNGYSCFSVFDATENGNWQTTEEIIEQTNDLIVAHRLEQEDSLIETLSHPTTTYPPEE